MHMLVLMYYCIYMFSYGPYGPEIKHYYYYYNEDIVVRNSLRKNVSTEVEQYIHNGI